MNQNDLIDTIHTEVNDNASAQVIHKGEIKRVLEALGSVVTEEMKMEDGEITLPGLGKLKAATSAARTGRNPQTGAAIEIPAKNVVKFVAAKVLKDALA